MYPMLIIQHIDSHNNKILAQEGFSVKKGFI